MKGNIGYFTEPRQFRELLDMFIPPIEELRENMGGTGYKDDPIITRKKLDDLLLKLKAINPEEKMPVREDIDALHQFFIELFGDKGFFN